MGCLNNRTALITNAADPIGQAVALAYAAEGADLLLHHRHPEDAALLSDTVRRIIGLGHRVILIQADDTTPDGAYTVVETAITGFGGVDVLVNNAPGRLTAPVGDLTHTLMETVMASSLGATLQMIRLLLPQMRARGYGRIINTVAGTGTLTAEAATTTAAAAIIGYTGALAREVAAGTPDIAANVVMVNPGATPGQLTPAYVFLARQDARAMVGACLAPGPALGA